MKLTLTLIISTVGLTAMVINSAAETLAATLNPPAPAALVWDPTTNR